MTLPIAILGAGPSGLLLGRLLELANIDYIIFERDESRTVVRQGGTLDIHADSGQLALQEAGLYEKFKSFARYDAPTAIADKDGKVVGRYAEEGHKPGRPEIDRKDLRELLLDAVPEAKVRWASKVKEVTRDEEGTMSVPLDNDGVESGFRLVVGADGYRSRARKLITSAEPQYSGLCYMTTSVQPSNPLYSTVTSMAGQGTYMACGESKATVAQRLGDDSYSISIGLPLPEGWNADNATFADPLALRQWLLQEHFGDWAQVNTDLIKHSEGAFRPWPTYIMPVESLTWEPVSGVTLVGDAAHVCPPSGDGVNYAMYDSLQLAQQIKQFGIDNMDEAVREYEKLMLPRARDLVTKSAEINKMLFAPDAPKPWLDFAGTGSVKS